MRYMLNMYLRLARQVRHVKPFGDFFRRSRRQLNVLASHRSVITPSLAVSGRLGLLSTTFRNVRGGSTCRTNA